MDASEAVFEFIGRLRDLPCWECRQGHGSWLSFHFGQPHLEIREPIPDSRLPYYRKRSVLVEGEHRFWIDDCTWHIVEGSHELAWNESDRDTIKAALGGMSGQKLYAIEVDLRRGKTTFSFETDIELKLKRRRNFNRRDVMWHLYSAGQELVQHVDGHLSIRNMEADEWTRIRGDRVRLDLTRPSLDPT